MCRKLQFTSVPRVWQPSQGLSATNMTSQRNISSSRTYCIEEVPSKVRAAGYICAAVVVASFSIRAQVVEPILTKSAIPFGPGAGAVKLDYAGGIGQGGGNSQVIPEGTLEVGLSEGWEVLARFPLLRVNLQP